MRGRILGAVLALSCVGLAAASCSSPESLGRGFEVDAGGPAPSFTNTDASLVEASVEGGLRTYCPSNRCPANRTTCPSSRFPCDVDLMTDLHNCGQCGHSCSDAPPGVASVQCVEGKCVMTCHAPPGLIDCDGIPDNGCETDSRDDDNCGGCGNKCDPAKPCVVWNGETRCGCPGDLLYCPQGGARFCWDGKTNDRNCGACGNQCNPDGNGAERPTNTYFGCVDGQCDVPKCEGPFLDCDKDMSNGCETLSLSADNCGSCGNVCPPGMECKGDKYGQPTCSCPGNLTYCPIFCLGDLCLAGQCVDLGSDRLNCGACGNVCSDPPGRTDSTTLCTSGMCRLHCGKGRADCNGNPLDDCEVNTDSDPQNCGACGRACDAIAGQACVGGQCVVEPCDEIPVDGGPR